MSANDPGMADPNDPGILTVRVTILTASNPAWPIPAGATKLRVELGGGGGGGGGGGSAGPNNACGAGGVAGHVAKAIINLDPRDRTLNINLGNGGNGGLADVSGVGGHAGVAGTASTITGNQSGIVYMQGNNGVGGGGGGANSASVAASGLYGEVPGAFQTNGCLMWAGSGGVQGNPSPASVDGVVGGGPGGQANAAGTSGGNGGNAMQAGATLASQAAGATGGSATINGSVGQSATQPGCGGGGGGGGATAGVGGNGGAGAGGFAHLEVVG